jgi:pSer/pThr/pTyr-binding forkhead associated (FHA) protein
MNRRSDEPFDPGQPALIVMHSTTSRRHRPLNRPLVILGKARGCDIGLVAPDVSNVHCVITREADGFSIRDCSSRSGTRVNGEQVTQGPLRDQDILQIGPFSFQVHIPPGSFAPQGTAKEPERVPRLQRSRRNLARIALSLRRRLRVIQLVRAPGAQAPALAPQQAEFDAQAANLPEQLREFEQRRQQLEKAERDLACDRETLNHEFTALQTRFQQAEQEIACRQEEVESEIRSRWEEFQQRMRREESQAPAPAAEPPPPSEEAVRQEAIRRRELDAYARHLKRGREQQQEQQEKALQTQQELGRAYQEMQQERQRRAEEVKRFSDEQAAAAAQLEEQKAAIARAEATLRDQRKELVRMMAELKAMQDAARSQEQTALRKENEYLRQLVAERGRQVSPSPGADDSPTPGMGHTIPQVDPRDNLIGTEDTVHDQPPRPAAKPASGVHGKREHATT